MMSKKEPKQRIVNAFQAMKAIGLSEDKVKPALKKLLKLYDKNWERIEEGNYIALADAIFESEEAEAVEHANKFVNNEEGEIEDDEAEECVQPLKRLRLKHRDNQSSSSHMSGSVVALPKINVISTGVESLAITCQSLGKRKEKQIISRNSLIDQERCQPSQSSGIGRNGQNIESRTGYRGKQSLSPGIASNVMTSVPQSSSNYIRFKEPQVEREYVPLTIQKNNAIPVLMKPKDEPFTEDIPLFHAPSAVISPNASNLREKKIAVGTTSSNESRKKLCISDERSSNLVIASTPSGEVNISLSCSLALQKPDFQMPTLETVLKLAEDKCLKSYKNLDPDFSLMNMMTEVCQCFLEVGSKHSAVDVTLTYEPIMETVGATSSTGPLETTDVTLASKPNGFVKVSPARELVESLDATLGNGLMNRSSAAEVLYDRDMCSSLNGSVDPLADEEVSLLTARSPHCNRIYDGSEPDAIDAGCECGSGTEKQHSCAEKINDLSLVTPEMIRSVCNIDVAKGQENVVILLVNGVNDESPPSFYYMPQSEVFESANVNFSLACIGDSHCCSTCYGDCLSLVSSCACGTGAGFAYNVDGLVKEDFLEECISMKRDAKNHHKYFCKECPLERSKSMDNIDGCKGHLLRKFIKECWLKCGCNKQCGNRVVQRGVSHNLQVFMTPEGKGWGLRTLVDLPKGAFVCEYVGEILTAVELFDRLRSSEGEKYSHPVLLDAAWLVGEELKGENALGLDATQYGNAARFINHRCYDSNLVEIPVELETPDRHYYHVALFTTRYVKAMEELTWDYGNDFEALDHHIKTFRCLCGSNFCRNK